MAVQQFDDAVEIDGSQDITQLKIQGHSTQTEPLQVWEDSAADEQAQISGDGRLQIGSFASGMMATDDALIEAHRDENDTSKPTRGLHLLGEVSGTLSSIVSWAVQELVLKGSGGISALHSALRVRLTNENTGTMDSGVDLRAADVEIINDGGGESEPVPEITGLHVTVNNQAGAYAETAYGIRVRMNDDGDLETAYAIHTDQGVVHLGDELELKIFDPLPSNDPSDTNHLRLFATVEGGSPRLYGKVTGEDPELIAGGSSYNAISTQKRKIQTHTLLWKKTLSSTDDFDTNDTPDKGSADITGYDHILIRGRLRVANATTSKGVVIFFNNDTTATNYHNTRVQGANSTALAAEADDSNVIAAPGSNSTANDFNDFELHLPEYGGGKRKQATAISSYRIDAGASHIVAWSLNWENAAAITRINLQPNTFDGFVAGSFIEIIGIKEEKVVTDVGFPTVVETTTDTTDGNATTIDSLATLSDQSYIVSARVVARRTGGSAGAAGDSAVYVIRGAFKNVAGTVSQVGSTEKTASEDQIGWDVAFNISGTDVEIQVTGATDNDVTWICLRDVVTV